MTAITASQLSGHDDDLILPLADGVTYHFDQRAGAIDLRRVRLVSGTFGVDAVRLVSAVSRNLDGFELTAHAANDQRTPWAFDLTEDEDAAGVRSTYREITVESGGGTYTVPVWYCSVLP